MGGISKRVVEVGTDTCLLGFSGRAWIKSAAFDASTLKPDGMGGVNEVQTVSLTGAPTGGTITLSFKGSVSGTIAFNAAAATVQAALEALDTIDDGDVHVSGSAGGPWAITFINTLGHSNQPLLVKNAAGLTGGTSPNATVVETTAGSDVGFDPRILVGSATFPGTIVTKVDGGSGFDKVKEYTGSGTIFGVIDGVEEFLAASSAGDRDVAVYLRNCVFDARKIKNYATYKSAFDAWAATGFNTVEHG